MNEEIGLLIIAFFITTVPLLVGHWLLKKKIEEIHFSMLTNGLSKIADSYKVKTIKDFETGLPAKYLLFSLKDGVSLDESFEVTKALYKLPGAKEFLITEDFSEDKIGFTKLY